MEKPIIATTLSGLFIKSDPWKKAHILWYKNAAEKLNDSSIEKLAEKPGYSKNVDLVTKKLYPELPDKERTIKAREIFSDSVVKYIEQHQELKNQEVIEYFSEILKKDFLIALVTTNTSHTISRILKTIKLENLFDIKETSREYEKDDKVIVLERFIKKYGKPIIYIGGDRKDSFDYCDKNNISCIFANLENQEDIEGVTTIHALKELKKVATHVVEGNKLSNILRFIP